MPIETDAILGQAFRERINGKLEFSTQERIALHFSPMASHIPKKEQRHIDAVRIGEARNVALDDYTLMGRYAGNQQNRNKGKYKSVYPHRVANIFN